MPAEIGETVASFHDGAALGSGFWGRKAQKKEGR
jgi:hypothetical protein